MDSISETAIDSPADLTTTFFTAAERRDYRLLKQCLRAGIDPNVYRNYFTVLHIAAMNGDVILLEYMIRLKKIDINVRSLDFQMTPLHLATKNQRTNCVKILLNYGADVDAPAKDDKRPIHLAVLSCNMGLIKELLKFNPELNVIDTFSHTPLSIAILDRTNYSVAELLCRHDARPYLERPSSIPLLYEAILNFNVPHYMRLIRLLVRYGSDVNEVDMNGRNALHFAAIVGSEILVEFLFKNGCDGNQTDITGRGPIHYAVMHGNHDVAKLLSMNYKINIPRYSVAESAFVSS